MKFFVCYMVFLLCNLLHAQIPYHQRVSRATGLPCDEVYNIHQDKNGFMWMATDKGLIKYDGVNYKTYYSDKLGNLAGSFITEDKYGKIWYATFSGTIFYVLNDKLEQFNIPLIVTSSSEFVILDDILITCNIEKKLTSYSITTGKLIRQFPAQKEMCALFAGNNYIAYLSDGAKELELLDKNLNEIEKIPAVSNQNLNIIHRVNFYNGEYFFIQKNNNQFSIHKYAKKNGKKFLIQLPQNLLIQNITLIDSNLWISTRTGIFEYSISKNKIERHLLADYSISCVTKDVNGYFWISSTSNGVFIFPPNNNQFIIPNKLQNFKFKKINNEIYLLNNRGAVFHFSNNTLGLTKLGNEPNNNIVYDIIDCKNTHQNENNYFNITSLDGNNLLAVTGGCKQIVKINEDMFATASNWSGNVFVKKDKASKYPELDQYKIANTEIGGYQNYSIAQLLRCMSVAYNKHTNVILWASAGGLFYLKDKKLSILKDEKNLFFTKVMAWNDKFLLSKSNGTIQLANAKMEITSIEALNKFAPYSYVNLIDNKLILIGAGKLMICNLDQHFEFTEIAFENNISEINDVLLVDNYILISTTNTITQLMAPANKTAKQFPFYINCVRSVQSGSCFDNDNEFSYLDNNIEIEFSVLDYYNKNSEILYQINNGIWRKIGLNDRKISLVALSTGNYEIKFKVNGIIQEKIVRFEILKPIFLRWWFLFLFFLAVGLLIYLMYRWKINNSKNENKLLLEKANLEKNLRQSTLSSIKAQMNPHFLFNALNTVQSFIFTDDKRKASDYLSKFSKLTRNILEMSEKNTVALSEEISALNLYLELEKIRFNNELEYTIEFSNNVNTDVIQIPSMIIQPYVENAIKHGLLHKKIDRKLWVKFEKINHNLLIEIEDNGIGRERSSELNKIKESKHESFATRANLSRIEILNLDNNNIGLQIIDKVDENKFPAGTKVLIAIPIK